MLPRRCKKCRCYVAPHLKACPRCGTVAPSNVVAKPTKEEKVAARAALDEKITVIQGSNIHWVPSEFSLRIHQDKLKEFDKLLDKAKTPKARNTIRSEIRATKEHLARKHVPSGKKAWTSDKIATRHAYVTIFISPKGHKYVLAERDGPADLLIVPAKKKHRRATPVLRLQRLEKSVHMKIIKKQQKEEAVHSKRKKSKKAHRAKKRLTKRTSQ